MSPEIRPLFEAATRPFAGAGRYAWHFARGKLRHDPVFFSLMRRGLLPDRGTLLDLGCGQGILLALLTAAKEQYRAGAWPRDWPPPPLHLDLRGFDLRKDRVETARQALGSDAQVTQGDLRGLDLEPCSVIIVFDVMLYLSEAEQQRLLDRAAAALEPGGLLLLREADAGAGLPFQITKWSEQVNAALRGDFGQALHYRSAIQWLAELAGRGFATGAEPMSEGTPFGNVLFVARKAERVSAFICG
jgi:SAM-dependent methyltransferase